MALSARCRLVRGVLRVVGSRSGVVGAPAPASRCLYRQAVGGAGRCTRTFSSAEQAALSVTYEQVKELLTRRSGVLIDVREAEELRAHGSIPGSVNVPLGQVSVALQLKPEEFKERYGSEMPLIGDQLVFTCLAGIRSQKALEAAKSLGYSNVQHYPGGWQDWAKHEILQMKA